MVLKTFKLSDSPEITVEPLTPDSFAPYGGVISADHQIKNTNLKSNSANYGTAIKILKVSPIINNYENAPSGNKASANWNIFRCSPPNHILKYNVDGINGRTQYYSKVLERHPYSTQTFLPMGRNKNDLAYLVIVASNDNEGLPDPTSVKAFIAKGNQAVTYNVATWHAPMIALIDTLDFGVLIHENNVNEEDCQECYFDPGFTVTFDLNVTSRL